MSESGDSERTVPNQKKPVSSLPASQAPVNAKVKQKKIGHRRVDVSTGQTTYKKTSSEALSCCIQLGISHTVAKLSAKPERDVLMQDFQTVDSIPFPSQGSNITPAHHHGDFVFSSYAPTAFRYFRDLFGIQPEDYMLSISRHPLVELSNPGASGSLFFVTHDDEFIVKTVQAKEATFLQQLLPGYYMNIVQNPRTLLPKFYGLYTVNAGTRHTIRVVVMNNLLPRKIQMHLKFDLKGSTYNRKASKTERTKSVPTFKDLDLISDHPNGLLQVSSDIYQVLATTLNRDCLVLRSFKIMDYSLLLAIHNIDKCKGQSQSQEKRAELNDRLMRLSERSSLVNKSTAGESATASATNMQGVRNSQSVLTSTMLRNKYNADLDHWSGGIPAKNHKGEQLLIFCGIIDILQCYKWKKKLEHRWKSIVADGDTVSVHRPGFYCDRFLKFMTEKVFLEDSSTIKTSQPLKRVPTSSTHRKSTSVIAPVTANHEQSASSSAALPPAKSKKLLSTSSSKLAAGETSFHKESGGGSHLTASASSSKVSETASAEKKSLSSDVAKKEEAESSEQKKAAAAAEPAAVVERETSFSVRTSSPKEKPESSKSATVVMETNNGSKTTNNNNSSSSTSEVKHYKSTVTLQGSEEVTTVGEKARSASGGDISVVPTTSQQQHQTAATTDSNQVELTLASKEAATEKTAEKKDGDDEETTLGHNTADDEKEDDCVTVL